MLRYCISGLGPFCIKDKGLRDFSNKMDAIFAWPPDVSPADGSPYTYGRDVCEGTIGSRDVVNTSEAIGFHRVTPLTSWKIWIGVTRVFGMLVSDRLVASGFVLTWMLFR